MKRLKEYWKEGNLLLECHYDKFNDIVTLLMINPETRDKKMISLKDIKIPIYVAKDNVDIPNYLDYIETKKTKEIYVNAKFREWNIARAMGFNKFTELVRNKVIDKTHIYLNKRLFNADTEVEDLIIEDYVRYHAKMDGDRFLTEFPQIDQFHIGVFDIESDITVKPDNHGAFPINMISYIDNKDYKCYSVFVKNPEYNKQDELINHQEQFKKEMKEYIVNYLDNIDIDEIDEEKKAIKTETIKKSFKDLLENISFEIKAFDTEKEMIEDFYRHVFSEKAPDILMAYNTKYDMGQTEARCKTLGIDFDKIIRYKGFASAHQFKIGNDNPITIKRFHDYYTRNMTKVVDYMLIYYHLRRANNYAKQSLDATARREIGVGKLDFSKICNWIGDFPYKDFKTFLMYNIIDNISLLLTERNTNDIYSTIYTRFDVNTEWTRMFKPMDSVTNTFDNIPKLNGFVPGNNINKVLLGLDRRYIRDIQKKDEGLYNVAVALRGEDVDEDGNVKKVEGGFVSNPNNVSMKIRKNKVYGLSPKGFFRIEDAADSDAKEMYPSHIRGNNSSKGTLIGTISRIGEDNSSLIGHKASISFINQNFDSMGQLLFNLPSAEDLTKSYFGVERKVKSRDLITGEFNNDPEVLLNVSNKEYYRDIKTFWRILYGTRYDDKDIDAGRPSINKAFITSDSKEISFQYYDTKVDIHINNEESFNRLIGISGQGFIFGSLVTKDNKLINKNNDYIEHLIPTKLPQDMIMEKISEGMLSEQEYEDIMNAKLTPIKLNFDGTTLIATKGLFFWDKTICSNFTYELFSTKDDHEYLLILKSNFKKSIDIDITQSMIIYNID